MNNTEEIPAGDSSTVTQYIVADMIKSSYAHYIIFGCAVFALCWAGWCTFIVNKVEIMSEHVRPNDNEEEKADPKNDFLPWTAEDCTERMI